MAILADSAQCCKRFASLSACAELCWRAVVGTVAPLRWSLAQRWGCLLVEVADSAARGL
jgi:hypothetical protein